MTPTPMGWPQTAMALCLALSLGAAGAASAQNAPRRGSLYSAATPVALSKSQIDQAVSNAEAPLLTNDPNATSAQGNAQCSVRVVELVYYTITPAEGSTATDATSVADAVLLVPNPAPGTDCARPWPLLSHQHGTAVPAAGPGPDSAAYMAAYYASQGYVVVLPIYHGYSHSSLPYHPYLQAEPSAAVVIDAIRAARNWLQQAGLASALSSKLFLSGTSEGGFVTLAAQRTMERDFPAEFAITASSPTSGPYQPQTTFDLFMSQPDSADESKTLAATLTLEGYQRSYAPHFSDFGQVYNLPWASEMGKTPPLLPSTQYGSETAVRRACQLPFNLKDAASESTPTYPGCSTQPLLTQAFVDAYSNRIGLAQSVRMAAGANNLLQQWRPRSRTFVCYGNKDPMATPNARAVAPYFAAQGVASLLTTEYLEVETREPIAHWMATQSVLHPPAHGYHGMVEGPACTSWSRHSVFDPLR